MCKLNSPSILGHSQRMETETAAIESGLMYNAMYYENTAQFIYNSFVLVLC